MPDRTPLSDAHRAAGGRLVEFAGWELPVQFAGIQAEHQAVRGGAGLFDIGHMGRLRVAGPGALAFLAARTCRRLDDLPPGRIRYSLALGEDGGAIDDLLIGRDGAESFQVVCNAGNRAALLAAWTPVAGVAIDDHTAATGMVAVQGPAALGLLAGLGLDARGLHPYGFTDLVWQGAPLRLSRTGYTGEDGAELILPAERTAALWQAVLAAGAAPCGLGARDTLRLEAGMPLYGHELDRTTSPVEAGLGWAVDPRGGFAGAARVLDELTRGPGRRLAGLRMVDKRVPRQGYPALADGRPVGVVTSGTLSPTLGAAIGMAYLPAALATPGTRLTVDVRGQVCAAEVVPLPFYRRPR